jgi:hypothetical protein
LSSDKNLHYAFKQFALGSNTQQAVQARRSRGVFQRDFLAGARISGCTECGQCGFVESADDEFSADNEPARAARRRIFDYVKSCIP